MGALILDFRTIKGSAAVVHSKAQFNCIRLVHLTLVLTSGIQLNVLEKECERGTDCEGPAAKLLKLKLISFVHDCIFSLAFSHAYSLCL